MAPRPLLLPVVLLLCGAAACSSEARDEPHPDATTVGDVGTDLRDVSLSDSTVGETGTDRSDASLPDVHDPGEAGIDADGSRHTPDGDGNRADSDAGSATDGNDAQIDGDANRVDGDASPADSDANRVDGDSSPVDGDGSPLSCRWTNEQLFFTVTLPDGSIDDCWNLPIPDASGVPRRVHRVLSGVVRDSSTDAGMSSRVVIDTCAGDAGDGCGSQNTVIDVRTPMPFMVPVGAYVEAEYAMQQSFGCGHVLRITNLSEWNGSKNPISDVDKTYVALSDGWPNSQPEMAKTGISVFSFGLGCPNDEAGCGAPRPIDTYAFRFSASGSATLTVLMGESLPWTVNGQSLLVRNHRSYQSTLCDDYWSWGFSIVGQ